MNICKCGKTHGEFIIFQKKSKKINLCITCATDKKINSLVRGHGYKIIKEE
jgi:hypothetical protein